ncbi:MAG TPA: HlyD family efflux transporter periplasmic adaptor subunit [Chthoniobacter sp.]|jgi:HlyD family secretion protein
MKASQFVLAGLMALSLVAFSGCHRQPANRVQGYVEGEFVFVASPNAGQLETVSVKRGDWVKPGDPLFALECGLETAAKEEAERKVAQGKSNLEDAKKGKRPPELESAEAQLNQARAALVMSEKEFKRQDDLFHRGVASADDFDRARSTRDQDDHRVKQMEADLETAHLGSRADQIAAAEANMRALQAALAQADWNLSQKRQSAPQYALVYDLIYEPGDWVPAGKGVVELLPPENVKVRAFVPEKMVGSIQPGSHVSIMVDGVSQPFEGHVTYISPQAEYTPPVIYSQESREKFVFMVEARFDVPTASKLHPGQPVDVQFR